MWNVIMGIVGARRHIRRGKFVRTNRELYGSEDREQSAAALLYDIVRNSEYGVTVAFYYRSKRGGEWLWGVSTKCNGWDSDSYWRATMFTWHTPYFSPDDVRTDEKQVRQRDTYATRSGDRPGHVTRSCTVLIIHSAMDASAPKCLNDMTDFYVVITLYSQKRPRTFCSPPKLLFSTCQGFVPRE